MRRLQVTLEKYWDYSTIILRNTDERKEKRMTRIPTTIQEMYKNKVSIPGRYVEWDYIEPSHHNKRFITSMLVQKDAFDSASDWKVHEIVVLVCLNDAFLAVVDIYHESRHTSDFIVCWWTSFLDFDYARIEGVEEKEEALERAGFTGEISIEPVLIFMTESEVSLWNAFAVNGLQLRTKVNKSLYDNNNQERK